MSTSLPGNAPPRGRRTYFYLALPVLMLAIVLSGFWPQYYGRLLSSSALDIGSSHVLVQFTRRCLLAGSPRQSSIGGSRKFTER